ncbi:MAG: hypothetical protein WAS54_09380 [Scrofimicrobium sp.]
MRKNTFAAVLGSVLLLSVSLASCSSAKSITCDELGALGYSEGTNKVMDLIEAHDLDPYSNAIGAASVVTDVYQFCGMSTLTGGPATRNNDQPIDSGVNWSEYGD